MPLQLLIKNKIEMKALVKVKRLGTLLYIFFICTSIVNAQLTEVLSGLTNPAGIYKNGSHLYYCINTGSVMVKDLDSNNPPTLVEQANSSYRMIVSSNKMYVSHMLGGYVSILDLNENNPQVIGTIQGFTFPAGFAIHNNYLYVSEWYGQIFKIDLSDPNYSIENFAYGFEAPYGPCY